MNVSEGTITSQLLSTPKILNPKCIAEVPELPGCSAHGKTRVDALKNVDQAINLWVETATEFGDPIPQPKGRKLMYA